MRVFHSSTRRLAFYAALAVAVAIAAPGATAQRAFYFVVGGAEHGLMRTDRFYDYAADGVRLRDWVAALIDGAPVDDVRCAECTRD